MVHDQLYTFGGAERVLAEILNCFPEADVFALFDILPAAERAFLHDKPITTTSLQRLPRLARWHRYYFPLMPLMIEQLDLRGYDIVLSSSYLVAKGIVVSPDQLHISYVHSPMRYAWDQQHQYLEQMKFGGGVRGLLVRALLHYMRIWDSRTSAGVDAFVVNSHFIGRRLAKVHNRQAEVIYPPVALDQFICVRPTTAREPFFVTVSRLVPYKRVDLIVEAFRTLPEWHLVVIGEGPETNRLATLAGSNVTLLGAQPDAVVIDHIQRAQAFLYAAEEDFGIAPVEAQGCGTPVIAYARGGVRETVRGLDQMRPTGVFYPEQTAASLAQAIADFGRHGGQITAEACVANATRFSAERFRVDFTAFVERHARLAQAPSIAASMPSQVAVGQSLAKTSLSTPGE